MTRAEHIHALLEDYARQRADNERDQARRYREAVSKAPRIEELRNEGASLALRAMRAILEEQSQAERERLAQSVKSRGHAINAEIRELLKSVGLPEDALDMTYRCPVCKDTGYVGEAPARFCDCFEQRLRLRQYEDGSMAGLDEQNFGR
ncbi:MAG: hypothetical protein ACSW8J_01755, partial [bacterium]